MAYCTNCGKETDWTSKSGFCKECAEGKLSKPATPPAPKSAQHETEPVNLYNGWIVMGLVCMGIALVCLFSIGLTGGFPYVGGDAYNMQITGLVALGWFMLALISTVIGATKYIGHALRIQQKRAE